MKKLRRLVQFTGVWFSLAIGPMLAVPAFAAIGDSLIDAIASDLGRDLDEARLSSVPSSGAYAGLIIKFAAFKPVGGDGGDLAAEVEAVTMRLTAAMQNRFADRFRFVSDSSHAALVAGIAADISDEQERARVIADLEARGKPDILIHSLVYGIGGQDKLAFQAISVGTAEILATSRAVALLKEEPQRGVVQVAVTQPSNSYPPPSGSDGIYRPIALEAEKLLIDHGYDPGRVDGYIDEDLRGALRDYQADSALVVNGRMTWETVENLRRDRRPGR